MHRPDQMKITGECFCGAVTYAVEKPLKNARACHCSRCRKAFSGASSAYAEVEADAHCWTAGEDKLSCYQVQGGWSLAFCSECGSTLAGMFDGAVHGITLGTFNGDPQVALEKHIFVDSKAPWDHIGGDAPQFAEGSPE